MNCRGTYDFGPACLKSVAERKAILREFQNLSEALISQQSKFDLAIDRIKDERKKHKKIKKEMAKNEVKKKDYIEYLKERIEDLNINQQNLLDDLAQQQDVSKEALQCLENLKCKFEEEKKVIKEELDHYYNMLIQQERDKYDSIYQRYKALEVVEKKCKEADLKYSNAERAIKEQKESIENLQKLLDDANSKNKFISQQLEEKEAQATVKQDEMAQTIEDLKNIIKMQRLEHQEELKVKQQELNMKNKEVETLRSSFNRKYAAFDARNNELSCLLETKENELLEERIKRDEFECELKRLADELEDQKLRKELDDGYSLHTKSANSDADYNKSKMERTDFTYDIQNHNLSKDKEFGKMYTKLSSELNNLRNEIKNMKSDRSSAELNRNYSQKNYFTGNMNINNSENFAEAYQSNKRGVLEKVSTS